VEAQARSYESAISEIRSGRKRSHWMWFVFPQLLESMRAVVEVQGQSAFEIFGEPDDLKLRSCATLFATVSPAGSIFHQVLDRYFAGEPDVETLRLLGRLGPLDGR
jgi:uncharacterized protein (DUF1810 family)